MVGNAEGEKRQGPSEGLAAAMRREYPELAEIVAAAGRSAVYAVGGAVRDLLSGRSRTDLDLVVEGDVTELAARLGGSTADHTRFLTACVRVGDLDVDLARARTETYSTPGALPDVRPATIGEDLARRDFTVNAMAIAVANVSGEELIDPYGGRDDLAAGVLRALHRRSFEDDPTRVLRGARYAAGYALVPDRVTAEMIAAVDLSTVSTDRIESELKRIAAGRCSVEAFSLLIEWEVIEARPGAVELAAAVRELLSRSPWSEEVDRAEAIGLAVSAAPGREIELARQRPDSASEGYELASRFSPAELAVARASGADWLEDYVSKWRDVELAIDGNDLIAAGIEPGPAIGQGLRAARREKLDAAIEGRETELAVALAAAKGLSGWESGDGLG